MAEPHNVAQELLKKLEDQLTCGVCLDSYKDPRLLQCFHVFCKDCLERLVVQDHKGLTSVSLFFVAPHIMVNLQLQQHR